MFGASSSLSTAKELGSSNKVPTSGQAPPSMAEMSKVAGLKNPSGRTVEPPLEVLLIYVWSPSSQNAKLPPTTPEDEGRDCFGTEGDEDSLLTNSELASGAILSIIRDSDLKRADAMFLEEALAMKPRENPIFLKNGQMVISVKIQNFSRSRMTKQTSLLESSREI